MRVHRILAVARKSLSQFRHDKRTLGFVVGMPLLMVIAFGYTFGGEVHDVRTLVVNQDAGPVAGLFLGDLDSNTLALVAASDPASARSEVALGHAWAVLWFPANFSSELLAGHATLRVSLDGSSPPIVSAVLGALRAAAEKAFAGAGGAAAGPLPAPPREGGGFSRRGEGPPGARGGALAVNEAPLRAQRLAQPPPGRGAREARAGRRAADGWPPEIADDRLRLIAMCCHPLLSTNAQVALTLRMVAGLRPSRLLRASVREPTGSPVST